jgi:hypothetical protein
VPTLTHAPRPALERTRPSLSSQHYLQMLMRSLQTLASMAEAQHCAPVASDLRAVMLRAERHLHMLALKRAA